MKNGEKVLAFIQARTTSTRFPNKIYQDLNGAPLLYHTIARAKETSLIDDVIVCSPKELPEVPDGIMCYVCPDAGENDVLSRFFYCMRQIKPDYIVRLTADCPLLDPELINFIINCGLAFGADYASNVLKLTFPDGVDCEMLSSKMLAFLHETVKAPYHREHVTTALRDNPKLQSSFDMVSVESVKDFSRIKLSVDTPQDLDNLRLIATELFL